MYQIETGLNIIEVKTNLGILLFSQDKPGSGRRIWKHQMEEKKLIVVLIIIFSFTFNQFCSPHCNSYLVADESFKMKQAVQLMNTNF